LKKYLLIISIIVIVLSVLLYKQIFLDSRDSGILDIIKSERLPDEVKAADIMVLKIAHYFPESHPQHIALSQKFSHIVESGSDWKIRVEIYPNAQLGDEQTYIQGIKNGTIEMCIGRQSLSEIFPKLTIAEFPYIFDNYEQVKALLNGEVGDKITEGLEDLGAYSLGWSLNGFRQISVNKTSINPFEKEKKLKLATSFFEPGIETLRALGFDVFPVSINQTQMALKQNMVDGQDNPPLLSYYNGWYESQTNILMTNHIISSDMYLVSKDFWEDLSEEHKELLKYASRESINYEIELLKQVEQDIFDTLEENGVKLEYPDISSYKEMLQPYYIKWINNDVELKEVYEFIQEEKMKILD